MINRQQILSFSALAFTVLLLAMLANQLASYEYFGAHLHKVLSTPSIWVALTMLGLSFATAATPQKIGLFAVFWIVALVFLRAHGADLPLFAATFKIISYVAAGDVFLGAIQTLFQNPALPTRPKSWPINLCVGIALTVMVASLLSVSCQSCASASG